MTLESSKTLGEIGGLLMVIGPVAGAYAGILGLVGLVLLLVAFNDLANHYQERRIFSNALYGGVAFVVGAVVAVAIIVIAAVGILTQFGLPMSRWSDPTAWQGIDWKGFTNWSSLAPYIGEIVVALVILFASAVVASILIRRSLGMLAQKSGTAMFATSGLILLIGAALTIILVGVVLLWIALVLLTVAFFQLRTGPTQSPT